MENLNEEQVKRALECCYMQELEHNENCPECPYTDLYSDCAEYLGKHALAFINSQDQRIADLETRLRYLLQSKTIAKYDKVDIHTKEYVKDIHSLDANIKELTEELTRKETEYNELYELSQAYKANSEAYRSYSKTLEKENETLKTLLDESFDTQNSMGDKIEKLTEENERLRNRITCSVTITDEQVEKIEADCLESIELDIKAIQADTLEEYRKRVYRKMEKYTIFGREYMQRIMREVAKEMLEGEK